MHCILLGQGHPVRLHMQQLSKSQFFQARIPAKPWNLHHQKAKADLRSLCRMLNSWVQAAPQLQQLGRLDPQVIAGVLQAQPQLMSRIHQHAASQQLLQVHRRSPILSPMSAAQWKSRCFVILNVLCHVVLSYRIQGCNLFDYQKALSECHILRCFCPWLQAMAMQMQIPQASDIDMPAPVMATTALGKPPRHAEAAPADENKTLHPQISLEAAKVQQLGASLGTKLRPESAQKIQVCIRQ